MNPARSSITSESAVEIAEALFCLRRKEHSSRVAGRLRHFKVL